VLAQTAAFPNSQSYGDLHQLRTSHKSFYCSNPGRHHPHGIQNTLLSHVEISAYKLYVLHHFKVTKGAPELSLSKENQTPEPRDSCFKIKFLTHTVNLNRNWREQTTKYPRQQLRVVNFYSYFSEKPNPI